MKAINKILAFLISIISIATFAPVAVFAAPVTIIDSGKCGDNATWTLDSAGTLTISGKGDTWDVYDVPDSVTGLFEDYGLDYKISDYGPFNKHLEDIKQIIVEEGITGIGSGEFADFSHLHTVSVADTVQRIGRGAFFCCSELSDINLPDNIKQISAFTFHDCISLKALTVRGKVEIIEPYAFDGCSGIKELKLPDSLTEIGDYAFFNCFELEKVNLPDNIRNLGAGAFDGCRSLKEVRIPKKLTALNANLFSKCKSLVRVEIPENVTTIFEGVFAGCESLEEVIFPSGVSSIRTGVLFNGCASLKKLILPQCTDCIDEYAFSECSSLEELVIPSGVTRIGECAFYGCSSIRQITVPEGVTHIGRDAFNGCASLLKLVIPQSVTEIYDNSIENGKLTIYGYKGSEAEKYAKNNNIPFKYLFADIDALSSGPKRAIQWADEAGIVKGYDDGTFRPDEICTRAQMVVMLWRLAGRINPASMNSAKKFSDVANLSAGVQKAIAWAVENGIIKGYADGTFRPGEKVTRQQTMIMLWRLAGKPEPEQAATVFTDMGTMSSGIRKAVYWGCETGITKGTRQADGTYKFNSQDGCKRQHSATFIFRYARLAGILSADRQ